MSRPYIYLEPEKGVATDLEEVSRLKNQVVGELLDYLGDYEPARWAPSKSNLMGPVGKLISAVTSGRFENREAIVGYVVNIHSNTSIKPLSPDSMERLRGAVNDLMKLREIVPSRMWLRYLREIDYAVFSKQYERVSHSLRTSGQGKSQ